MGESASCDRGEETRTGIRTCKSPSLSRTRIELTTYLGGFTPGCLSVVNSIKIITNSNVIISNSLLSIFRARTDTIERRAVGVADHADIMLLLISSNKTTNPNNNMSVYCTSFLAE